jgi:hypothetical protein
LAFAASPALAPRKGHRSAEPPARQLVGVVAGLRSVSRYGWNETNLPVGRTSARKTPTQNFIRTAKEGKDRISSRVPKSGGPRRILVADSNSVSGSLIRRSAISTQQNQIDLGPFRAEFKHTDAAARPVRVARPRAKSLTTLSWTEARSGFSPSSVQRQSSNAVLDYRLPQPSNPCRTREYTPNTKASAASNTACAL